MSDSDDEFTYESDSDYGYEDGIEDLSTSVNVNESFTEDQLLEKREVVIGEIADVLQVSPEVSRALLLHYRWDKDRLVSRFYEDPSETYAEAGMKYTEPNEAHGGEPGICAVCFEEMDDSNSILLGCGHRFTTDCLQNQVRIKVSEGVAAVPCLAPKCTMVLSDKLMKEYLDEKQFAVWKTIHANSIVQSDPNFKWCQGVECSRGLSTSNTVFNMVKCQCGSVSCTKCHRTGHYPATCKQMERWELKCKDDSETAHWMKANTKVCPKCGTSTEKNGGCNHMTCKVCSHHWCWVCQGNWDSHNDYYNCNKFKETDTSNDARRDLERYLHFFTRYNNHRKSLNFEKESQSKALALVTKLQKRSEGWDDFQFILNAGEQLVECRHSLMHTYIFGFYLREKGDRNKIDLFEQMQSDLEILTEELAKLIEFDATEGLSIKKLGNQKYELAVQEKEEEFMSTINRSSVSNLTRIGKKRVHHLFDAVDTGFEI